MLSANSSPAMAAFARRFSSEAALQQIVAGLLTRMPDVSGVQILQGTQELGKDLIFSIQGGFGETILCACVIKKTRITGSVSSSQGARTVYLQAEQAFDTPHLDDNGREVRVERVYIISPFDLPPATVRSLTGKLASRSGQIQFISGTRLFDLFKVHWPGVLADEFDTITEYLSKTETDLSEEKALANLVFQYQLGPVDKRIKAIYVAPTMHRDLRSYSAGPDLIAPFPSDPEIQARITHEQHERLLSRIRRFKSAMDALLEWEYVDGDHSSRLQRQIDRFVADLTADWTAARESYIAETFKRLLRLRKRELRPPSRGSGNLENDSEYQKKRKAIEEETRRTAEELFQKDGVALDSPEDIRSSAALLRAEIDSILARFNSVLDGGAQLVDRLNMKDREWLFDPTFVGSCRLGECVQQSPAGLCVVKKSITVTCSSEILDKWGGPILILGAAGFGKTSFCRWHALRDAERFSTGQSDIIPVYVALHKLGSGPLPAIRDLAKHMVVNSALLTTSRGPSDVDSHRIRVYLDGLDEIPTISRRWEVLDLARKTVDLDPGIQTVLTSRDYVYDRHALWIPALRLSEFEDNQVELLVASWLGEQSSETHNLRSQLQTAQTLKPLMRIPLLATLIILVFRQTRRLPENRTRLYEMFIDLLSGGWDLAKGVQRGSAFGSVVKLMVLKRLAAKIHMDGKRQFGAVDLKYTIRTTLSPKFLENWERLELELLQDGILSKVGVAYEFSHLSFQEFLVARDLLGDPTSRRADSVLDRYLRGEDWWKEVLSFYAGLAGKPTEILAWVSEARTRLSGSVGGSEARAEKLVQSIVQSLPDYVGT